MEYNKNGLIGNHINDEIENDINNAFAEAKKDGELRKKKSYGYNFENVSELTKNLTNFFNWSPFISYDGIDPDNNNLLKRQIVEKKYEEESLESYTPARTYYRGITRWFDGFGFEIRREIRESDSLENLKNAKIKKIITRDKGLIVIREVGSSEYYKISEDAYFDTGAPVLPDWDDEVDAVAYPTDSKVKIIERNPNLTLEEQLEANKVAEGLRLRIKDKPISVDENIDKEKILSQFERDTEYTKKFNHPNWKEYIDEKRKELEQQIQLQEVLSPLRKEIIDLEQNNEILRAQRHELLLLLNEMSSFTKNIIKKPFGKAMYGKKAKSILNEQQENVDIISKEVLKDGTKREQEQEQNIQDVKAFENLEFDNYKVSTSIEDIKAKLEELQEENIALKKDRKELFQCLGNISVIAKEINQKPLGKVMYGKKAIDVLGKQQESYTLKSVSKDLEKEEKSQSL